MSLYVQRMAHTFINFLVWIGPVFLSSLITSKIAISRPGHFEYQLMSSELNSNMFEDVFSKLGKFHLFLCTSDLQYVLLFYCKIQTQKSSNISDLWIEVGVDFYAVNGFRIGWWLNWRMLWIYGIKHKWNRTDWP